MESLIIIPILLVYIVFNTILKTALPDSFVVKIKFPPKKKYLSGKKSPIYLYCLPDYPFEDCIIKYELGYHNVHGFLYTVLYLFIPIITIDTYFYEYGETRRIDLDKDRVEGITSLEDYFEQKVKEEDEEHQKSLSVKEKYEQHIMNLNREFKENFE
jgi:hypothetical protein